MSYHEQCWFVEFNEIQRALLDTEVPLSFYLRYNFKENYRNSKHFVDEEYVMCTIELIFII